MSTKRILLVIVSAVIIGFCVLPMTTQANLASAGRAVEGGSCSDITTMAAPPSPGAQCIPCSLTKPCENPQHVCSYNGSSTHGCCLAYARLN